MKFGIPEWQADGLIEDYAHYSRGEASVIASGVQDATGKLPRSFEDFCAITLPHFLDFVVSTWRLTFVGVK